MPLIEQGMTLKEIGVRFNIQSPSGVKKWLDRYGISTKKNITMKKNRNCNIQSEYDWDAIQKYYDDNHTWKDVLNEFHISNVFLAKSKKTGLFKTRTIGESLKIANKLGRVDRSIFKDENYRKKLSNSMRKVHADGNHPGWTHINSRKDRRSYPERIFLGYFKNSDVYDKYRIEEKLPIGKYFLDFAIIDLKLNIEMDGSQHYNNDDSIIHDKVRNEYLKSSGWKVYRIKWSEFKINAKKEIDDLVSYIKNIHNETDRFYKLDDIKIKTYCKYCQKEIYKDSTLCYSCRGLKSRKVKRPSKEELKRLTETMSMVKIGKMFGVSDNSVRKWIKFYDGHVVPTVFETGDVVIGTETTGSNPVMTTK